MKKNPNLSIFFSLLLLLVTLNQSVFALDYFKNFNDQEIDLLASSINQNCQSEQFLINVKKNKQYPKFGSTEDWKKFCMKLKNTKSNLINFMNKNIKIFKNKAPAGLITGYYEPTIKVSFIKNEKYKHPILKKNKIYNLKSRSFIDKNYSVDDVILWTDDYINLFFLQIQGSGIGIFEDGQKIKVAYDGNNNLPYKSIGKILIKQNKIKPKQVDLFTIKFWLRNNQEDAYSIMEQNRRYIFFKLKESRKIYKSQGSLRIRTKTKF